MTLRVKEKDPGKDLEQAERSAEIELYTGKGAAMERKNGFRV